MTRWSRSQQGFSLIWALLLTSALLVITIAFLTLASDTRHRTERQVPDLSADELADSARAEILAKLTEAFSVETAAPRAGSVAASPGLLEVLRYDVPLNRGTHTGPLAFSEGAFFAEPFNAEYNGAPANPRWIPLFSWTRFAPRLKHLSNTGTTENPDYNPALAFNLNTTQNPFTPGRHLLSGVTAETEVLVREKSGGSFATSGSEQGFMVQGGTSSAARPVWVQWVPVRKNPLAPEGPENPIIGRYAYWVDVENSKLRADQPLQPLREHPSFARVLGDPDAVEGSGSWFAQSNGTNSALDARRAAEQALPPRDNESQQGADGQPLTRSGARGHGYAPAAAAAARRAWLGFENGAPPLAALTSSIDWDYFEAPWPIGEGSTTLSGRMARLQSDWASPQQRPVHPAGRRPQSEKPEEQLLAQTAASALTFYGHEEDLDPLGRPKIEIVDFQNAVTGGQTSSVSISAVQSSAVWSRLVDAAYHGVYVPGGWASGGTQRSYVDGLAHFFSQSGSANQAGSMARGFGLQMLVNIAEFSQPASVPPVVDSASGIVGARSMPYVAEVLTRARSAIYELPKADRENPAVLLANDGAGNFTYSYAGRPLQHYATHVLVEVGLALVNPNPFETEPFEGEVELNYEWVGVANVPGGSRPIKGPLLAPLKGRYTITPAANKDPKTARVEGDTVFFKLGKVSSSDLLKPTALQIHGWTIRRNGQIWHQVPLRHPGAANAPVKFWEMGKVGLNAGSPQDERSFAVNQQRGNRAVGWFAADTLEAAIKDTVYVENWNNSDPTLTSRVMKWGSGLAQRASLTELTYSIDPVLGHRTLDVGVAGISGNGHFYGVLGHTWRRARQLNGIAVPVAGRDTPEVKVVAAWQQLQLTTHISQQSVRVLKPSGNRLVSGSAQVDVPAVNGTLGSAVLRGEYLTHKYGGSGATGVREPEDAGFLTQLYLSPMLDGPLPQGNWDIETLTKDLFKKIPCEKSRPLNYVDIETNKVTPDEPGDWIKTSDGKKGARSLMCSAPAGRPCLTVGEIGFCHSGFTQTPIIVSPDEGRTSFQLNSPRNGPPMRMLLDLFKPRPVHPGMTEASWKAGSATTGQRHAWNINTSIAHDDYMALREGGDGWQMPKAALMPSAMKVHAVWCPSAQGFSRRSDGSEAFRGREAKQVVEKDPGHCLDRHLRPHPTFARPFAMWTGLVGGDISPARSGESQLWGIGNSASMFFGPALMTWEPGLGAQNGAQPYVSIESDMPAFGKLLALGVDARSDSSEFDDNGNFKPLNEGFLKGRFCSDQNMAAFDASAETYTPASWSTRFGLFPMRHFVSDLAVDFHQENAEGTWINFKTALNPGISAETLPNPNGDETEQERAGYMDGGAFPGGFHRAGVYYNAPMALVTNQAGISANAFTAYIVVQTIKEAKKPNENITQSGPGILDAADTVTAERWLRLVILKDTQQTPPRFRVVAAETANR
ncbi:MAG: hypothetical protein JNJ83_17080 [Verrucomicrobiaceae bacterium]|nr:hypothetical protein [Verrucomicrobiaceae bacterium]